MPVSEDTEITLGTGKLLAVFFGLVAVCAVFFGMGFSLGRAATKPAGSAVESQAPVTDSPVSQAATTAPASSAPADLSFYKAVQGKGTDAELAPPEKAPSSPSETSRATPPEPKAAKSQGTQEAMHHDAPPAASATRGSYYIQIAAVTKDEDAQALVQALKSKQYSAFSTTSPSDRFFHVQIGPFADLKDAEAMRAKLVSSGYTPILKR